MYKVEKLVYLALMSTSLGGSKQMLKGGMALQKGAWHCEKKLFHRKSNSPLFGSPLHTKILNLVWR